MAQEPILDDDAVPADVARGLRLGDGRQSAGLFLDCTPGVRQAVGNGIESEPRFGILAGRC